MSHLAGRKLIVCADGTWNTVEKTENGSFVSTNVSKLAASLARCDGDKRPQILCYLEGVGTNAEERVGGGAFGAGLSGAILQAYQFLVDTYRPDDTLHFFGFSRGAYTVRSLAGLLAKSGLLRRDAKATVQEAFALYRERAKGDYLDHVNARVFRQMHAQEVEIEFIGVWDTVGAMGLPLLRHDMAQWLGYAWEFHNVELGGHIRHACQALAIHELRSKFAPTLWEKPIGRTGQTLEQIWFSGAHADVGGGYADSGLSDIALEWMIGRASDPKLGGLAFRSGWRTDCGLDPRFDAGLHNEFKGIFWFLDALKGKRKGSLRQFNRPATTGFETCERLHESAQKRLGLVIDGDFWPESFRTIF